MYDAVRGLACVPVLYVAASKILHSFHQSRLGTYALSFASPRVPSPTELFLRGKQVLGLSPVLAVADQTAI